MQFSKKQIIAVKWWIMQKYADMDGIICDGAVRSGKTTACSLGFALWSAANFNGQTFAVCGKTSSSVKRNLAFPLAQTLKQSGFNVNMQVSKGFMDVSCGNVKNRFYFFGGKDEGSAALIQGLTLAGVLLDEVALMPRSFVEQAVARCSVERAKLWFNCNPENPYHWFYREYILKCGEGKNAANPKNLLYLHFTMDDNPSLSEKVKNRYKNLFSGTFYNRFVLGEWVVGSGLVYPMFDEKIHIIKDIPPCTRYLISCDYGTVNPTSIGLWGKISKINSANAEAWVRLREYYYDSRREGMSRTDEEHYSALERLAEDLPIEKIIVDPSAASFIECIRRHGKFNVVRAKNDVLDGIRKVQSLMNKG